MSEMHEAHVALSLPQVVISRVEGGREAFAVERREARVAQRQRQRSCRSRRRVNIGHWRSGGTGPVSRVGPGHRMQKHEAVGAGHTCAQVEGRAPDERLDLREPLDRLLPRVVAVRVLVDARERRETPRAQVRQRVGAVAEVASGGRRARQPEKLRQTSD